MRRSLRVGLLTVAALCAVAFVSLRHESKVREGRAVERQTVGLPFSPWFEYESWYETVQLPEGGTHSKRLERGQLSWASWSWFVAAGGLAAAVASWRLRPRVPQEAETTW